VSIVEHGLGLNITLQSYAGSLDFGILAARVGMPDARPVARGLFEALAELAEATDKAVTPAKGASDRNRATALARSVLPQGVPRRTRNTTVRTSRLSDA